MGASRLRFLASDVEAVVSLDGCEVADNCDFAGMSLARSALLNEGLGRALAA